MSNFDIPQSLGTAKSYGVNGEYRPFNRTQQLIVTHVYTSYCQKIRCL